MTRDVHHLFIADLSAFSKTLRKSLEVSAAEPRSVPGQAAMLGMLSKAAGFGNFQHLKAQAPKVEPELDELALKRALRVFDNAGLMERWPKFTKVQALCLWPFWARLPANRDLTEKEVNGVLKEGLNFNDHVLLRRSLIDHKLAQRSRDGRVYRRIEQRPPPEALALMARIAR